MSTLEVTSVVRIEVPAETVRAQFADVAHHAATAPHAGVEFEVVSEADGRCDYRQTSRVGPLRFRQELTLEHTESGPLVNSVTKGQFQGGTISFDVTPDGSSAATVEASIRAPLRGPERLLKPVLARTVARALAKALDEDKVDLESGRYPSA